MSTKTDILGGVRNLLVLLTDASAGQVINAGAKGTRPPLPYCTVRLTTPGPAVGPAERLDGLNGSIPSVRMRERREGSVSIQAFGTGAEVWLDQFRGLMDSPQSLAQQEDDGITIADATPPTDISPVLDTAEEVRYSMDVTVRYQHVTDAADQIEITTVQTDYTFERYDGDPDTLSETDTITLTYP